MSLKTLSTATGTREAFRDVQERVAADLLEVLRDALGPACRLPEPLPDPARYGRGSVTVRDGEGGRIELTAHLTSAGEVREYVIRLVREEPGGDARLRTAVGPLRMDLSQDPEERPSITYVLPLVIRLELGGERLCLALDALGDAGYVVDVGEGELALRNPCPWGTRTEAVIGLDPDSGALTVHGRYASTVRETLSQARVF